MKAADGPRHSEAHEQLGRIIAQLNKISSNLISSSKSERERALLNRHDVPSQSKQFSAAPRQTEYKSPHLVAFDISTAVTGDGCRIVNVSETPAVHLQWLCFV
jgi:hypothetical protein